MSLFWHFLVKIGRTLGMLVGDPDQRPAALNLDLPAPPTEQISTVTVPEPVTLPPDVPTERPGSSPADTATESSAKAQNPFPNKISGLSSTPLGKGWRTLLADGETCVLDGIAVLETANREDSNVVRIDVLRWGERKKLGYLTSGVSATLRTGLTKVNPDSALGRAIIQKAIPCRVEVYLGDINALYETDRYSYVYTDVVRRVKDVVKQQRKQNTRKQSATKPVNKETP